MDAAHCGFDSFCFQKFVPNTHSKNSTLISVIVISKSLWLLSPVTRVDLSEEMILCLICPVGVLAMTGMARGPLTGVSGITVAELMKG